MTRRIAIAISLVLLAAAAHAAPALRPGDPVAVRILYDNSGSMYPGYRPPGDPARRSRADLGSRYVHQSPAFVEWLGDFVQRQTLLDGATAGMWTFTSTGAFTPNDIQQVHPVVPLREFDAAAAIGRFPNHTGDNTYLTETLTTFTRDFTGLIWLITDNIVETDAGQPDEGVRRFFDTLARQNEFRSVHLFKYTVEEGGHTAALAVYGILVSASDVSPETLGYYDARFLTLLEARRGARGGELFPGREYLKLKNLAIDPLVLSADLQLVLSDQDKGMFKEGQSVQLDLEGEIRSRLTQHSVTAGRYELAVATTFQPEMWAQRDLGAQSLAPQVFDAASGEIQEEIPPKGSRRVHVRLSSTQPVSFTPSGLGEWLRLAWNGAAVRYTGSVRMSFTDVSVRLERQQMAGIFGIDQASTIFDFQDVRTLQQVRPSVVPVSFSLRTGSSRTAILLVALALLAAIGVLLAILLARKQSFDITITRGPTATIELRRLGTHRVIFDQKVLGRLSRGLVNGYAFDPVAGDRSVMVIPSSMPGTWDVKFTGGNNHQLSIKSKSGTLNQADEPKKKPGTPPPPPPPPKSSLPPRTPKIGNR
ncbi:MAG: hypothetical protein DMF56_19390 [Acidobacteria bacterium]|nr:MAG: hypothetical protein DMF56_19390 [Acidobacteriota bacterium]